MIDSAKTQTTPYAHKLKVDERFFIEVVNGQKPFEIRKDDRNYNRGDTVELHESQSNKNMSLFPTTTGRYVTAEIGFITRYGQADDFCVFGLLNISEVKITDDKVKN